MALIIEGLNDIKSVSQVTDAEFQQVLDPKVSQKFAKCLTAFPKSIPVTPVILNKWETSIARKYKEYNKHFCKARAVFTVTVAILHFSAWRS